MISKLEQHSNASGFDTNQRLSWCNGTFSKCPGFHPHSSHILHSMHSEYVQRTAFYMKTIKIVMNSFWFCLHTKNQQFVSPHFKYLESTAVCEHSLDWSAHNNDGNLFGRIPYPFLTHLSFHPPLRTKHFGQDIQRSIWLRFQFENIASILCGIKCLLFDFQLKVNSTIEIKNSQIFHFQLV